MIEAKDLEAKDSDGFSDPYCMLGIKPGSGGGAPGQVRTKKMTKLGNKNAATYARIQRNKSCRGSLFDKRKRGLWTLCVTSVKCAVQSSNFFSFPVSTSLLIRPQPTGFLLQRPIGRRWPRPPPLRLPHRQQPVRPPAAQGNIVPGEDDVSDSQAKKLFSLLGCIIWIGKLFLSLVNKVWKNFAISLITKPPLPT